MFLFDWFNSFLPLHNPIGFGVADFVELFLGVTLAALFVLSPAYVEPWATRFATRTWTCILLLAASPVVLRLLLLAHHPAPTPDIYDEFGHLFVADTLRHFRLANPPHALSQFFETFFILQRPTYSSIYPIGQGLSLALGRLLFGSSWGGVIFCVAAFCGLCYWMLLGWTTPRWALLGGFLAVLEFGPLSQWMNSYWGGALAAAAGCLVFGALPRLRRAPRTRDAVFLGLGLAIHLLTRPYESIFLVLCVLAFFIPLLREPSALRRLVKPAFVVVACVVPAIFLTLLQNKEVTGQWMMLPYTLSQYEYGVPTSLTFQANPTPHHALTPQQQMDYAMQTSFHPEGKDTFRSYLLRLEYRVRFYRFFFFAPLYIALVAFWAALREYRFAWAAITLVIFALGVNFFPAFQLHYIAAVTCLFVLVSVVGLERLSRISIRGTQTGGNAARVVVFLCAAQFIFWYGMHLFDDSDVSRSARQYETWDWINHEGPERRILVNEQLAQKPGNLLVFVRYWPSHIFQEEWVYNAADIDASRVVWARDLGATENEQLIHYYPSRTVWLLEPDADPPRLTPYQP